MIQNGNIFYNDGKIIFSKYVINNPGETYFCTNDNKLPNLQQAACSYSE